MSDRYKLQEPIGRGSWSVVYRAVDTLTGDVVAVKELIEDAGYPKREVRIGRQITHKNVCRIYDYSESPSGAKRISMEYVDGGNLRMFMEQSGPVPVETTLRMAGQVLDGLEAAHGLRVVHRDLKPENVLLTADGTVKLTDFGLARPVNAESSLDSLKGCGTPAYMAPEQLAGRDVDERADIFAFGIVLHELLSGVRVGVGEGLKLPDGVPAHVVGVIRRCLEAEPGRRFASVAEVRGALSGRRAKQRVRYLAVAVIAAVAGLSGPFVLRNIGPVSNPEQNTGGHRPPLQKKEAENPVEAKPVQPQAATQEKQIAGTLGPQFEARAAAGHSMKAFRAFSSGLYFLKEDLAKDALKRFDETLTIDPTYPGANHYRGLALAKLNRTDEAIDAFKRALPEEEPERLISWSWDAPVSAERHGVLRVLDNSQFNLQRDQFSGRHLSQLQKRFIYTERAGKTTALHFLDPVTHAERRLEIPDENIVLDGQAFGNDAFTLLLTTDRKLYGFSAENALLWHVSLDEYGNNRRFAVLGDTVYIYGPEPMRFDLLDARTGKLLWRREGLAVESLDAPIVRHTKRYGDVFIVKSPNLYRAIRKSDGKDAWTVPVQSPKASELASGDRLVVFEPERRIFTVNLETGGMAGELELEQLADSLRTPPNGSKWLVSAALDGNRLYVLSKDLELCAIDLRKMRMLWQTPLHLQIQPMVFYANRVYVGSASGELVILDSATGNITAMTKLTEGKPTENVTVRIDYVGDDGVVALSKGKIFGLDPSGVKNWEHPAFLSAADATYFNHTIVENTSPAQMTTLDVRTGKELWQYAASRQPWPYIFTNVGRLFLLDDKGVKEYAVAQPAESISDKQTQTELARAYLAKKDLKDAAVFAKKASDIDASYPPLVRVRAELLKAQGRGEQAAKELAQYAGLVGLDSKDGLRAVEELKQGYGLMWATPIGAPLAGEPVVVGDRVVSVGRGVERELAIVALNADSGETAWRFGAERFVASVVDGGGLWYAAGRLADGNAVELYRVDLRTGEQRPVASWRAAQHVDQAWIAAGSGKVFVAVTEGDLGKGLVTVGSAGFDMRSGARMSEKSYSAKVSAGKLELSFNLEKQEWVIEKKNSAAMPLIKSLWPPSGFRIQSNRLYAFTSEGLAYSTFYKEVEQTAPSARKSGNP